MDRQYYIASFLLCMDANARLLDRANRILSERRDDAVEAQPSAQATLKIPPPSKYLTGKAPIVAMYETQIKKPEGIAKLSDSITYLDLRSYIGNKDELRPRFIRAFSQTAEIQGLDNHTEIMTDFLDYIESHAEELLNDINFEYVDSRNVKSDLEAVNVRVRVVNNKSHGFTNMGSALFIEAITELQELLLIATDPALGKRHMEAPGRRDADVDVVACKRLWPWIPKVHTKAGYTRRGSVANAELPMQGTQEGRALVQGVTILNDASKYELLTDQELVSAVLAYIPREQEEYAHRVSVLLRVLNNSAYHASALALYGLTRSESTARHVMYPTPDLLATPRPKEYTHRTGSAIFRYYVKNPHIPEYWVHQVKREIGMSSHAKGERQANAKRHKAETEAQSQARPMQRLNAIKVPSIFANAK